MEKKRHSREEESSRILREIREVEEILKQLRKEIKEKKNEQALIKKVNLAEQKLKQLPNFYVTDGEKDFSKEGAKKELVELKTLQRVQAEFENSRKRLEKEKQEFAKIANAGLVKELLPLVDSIDAAEKHLQEKVSKEEAVKGMELIKKQLLSVLGSNGLEEIKCLDKKFDPMQEDCVMQGKDEGREEGIVLEELQKGYAFNGKVLRHAKVKVNKL